MHHCTVICRLALCVPDNNSRLAQMNAFANDGDRNGERAPQRFWVLLSRRRLFLAGRMLVWALWVLLADA